VGWIFEVEKNRAPGNSARFNLKFVARFFADFCGKSCNALKKKKIQQKYKTHRHGYKKEQHKKG